MSMHQQRPWILFFSKALNDNLQESERAREGEFNLPLRNPHQNLSCCNDNEQ